MAISTLRFLTREWPTFGINTVSSCSSCLRTYRKRYLNPKIKRSIQNDTQRKRVLILGGTSGIGLAVAKAAKAECSDVVVVSSKQSRVDSALTLLGEGTEGYVTNLSDETAVETLFGKMGPFDHLVYTAGDSVWQRLLGETKLEDAKAFFDVRFWGAFLVTKHASKLIRPDGSIVFTSSTVPRRPSVGFAIGASISSAVEAFAVAMAVELAPVRVNVVAPGIVRTPIWDRLPEEQREAFFAARALLCQLEGSWFSDARERIPTAPSQASSRPRRFSRS